jgi:hypothetical protein
MRREGKSPCRPRLGFAGNIQEANVCDIVGKVADKDAVVNGVVDGAGLLSNSSLGEGGPAQSSLMG